MLTLILVTVMVALLCVAGIFALMAKDNKRKGQSGSTGLGAKTASEGRAPGLD